MIVSEMGHCDNPTEILILSYRTAMQMTCYIYTRFRAIRENIAQVPGMYFHESEGRVRILPARVQYSILQGNKCNKRFILYSQLQHQ